MKKRILAPILSGLVFPGLGQFLNRQFVKGSAMVLAAAGLMVFVFMEVSSFLGSDMATVRELSPEGMAGWAISATQRVPLFVRAGVWAVFGIWIYGIIDAYMVARRREEETEPDSGNARENRG